MIKYAECISNFARQWCEILEKNQTLSLMKRECKNEQFSFYWQTAPPIPNDEFTIHEWEHSVISWNLRWWLQVTHNTHKRMCIVHTRVTRKNNGEFRHFFFRCIYFPTTLFFPFWTRRIFFINLFIFLNRALTQCSI